jgi:gluconate 5-dehydrogenase
MSVRSVHAFAEKVALVTDGTSPIGRAVAMQLALQGSYVIVGARETPDRRSDLLDELLSLGTLANAVQTDIATAAGVKTLVNAVDSAFGRLDLLVNCLKSMPDSTFEESGESEFDSIVGSNFKAAYLVTNACMPLMRDRPKPRIVNVLSQTASSNAPLFEATQAALIGFTRSLAATLPQYFRVNAVTSIESANARAGYDPELFPLENSASADDTARAVLYLLSPEAVGVNGQVLEVAG